MIHIKRYRELINTVVTNVNAQLVGDKISDFILSPTEQQATKKISDKPGILILAKMPPTSSEILSKDDYSENNQCLIFILKKVDISAVDDNDEIEIYADLQGIMQLVKQEILNLGMNNGITSETETLSKPFRTEWEYQIYGGFNGLSLSFDLRDFEL